MPGTTTIWIILDVNQTNTEPVIGIVTLRPNKFARYRYPGVKGMIASSYKKWVEMTGARAVVIPHFSSKKTIRKLMEQINGVLLPGGSTTIIK